MYLKTCEYFFLLIVLIFLLFTRIVMFKKINKTKSTTTEFRMIVFFLNLISYELYDGEVHIKVYHKINLYIEMIEFQQNLFSYWNIR